MIDDPESGYTQITQIAIKNSQQLDSNNCNLCNPGTKGCLLRHGGSRSMRAKSNI
jgi:hypothetical protein